MSTEQWKFETGNQVVSSPVVSDGIVYAGSADEHLYAVKILQSATNKA